MSTALGLAGATLLAFAALTTLAWIFAGLGLSVRRAFGLRSLSLDDIFLSFWMGFSLTILSLIVWHFFLPVGPAALAALTIAGLTGLVVNRMRIASALRHARIPATGLIAMLALALWIANLSLAQLTNWDSSLYHMQGVRWIREYAIVPGLANVFGPLGFNNASFLYNALLSAGPWAERSWHLGNPLLVLVLATQVAASAMRAPSAFTPSQIFLVTLFPFAVDCAIDGALSSYSTSLPASLLIAVAAAQAYASSVDCDRPADDRSYGLFCAVVMSSIAVTIKASVGVFAAAMLVLAVYRLRRDLSGETQLRNRAFTAMLAVAMLAGIAWCARGIVLSGYPLFPSPALGMNVDWRVPAEHARAELAFVEHSAKATAENIAYVSGRTSGLSAWLPNWAWNAVTRPYEIAVPVVVIVTALFVLWRSRRAAARFNGWDLLAPLGLSLVAWFIVAPMPHYGAAFFWSMAALLVAQASRTLVVDALDRRRFVLAIIALGLSACVINPAWAWVRSRSSRRALFFNTVIKFPTPGYWFEIGEPAASLKTYTTASGVTLNVPTGRLGRCWDAPLPCTPNPAQNLRLRVPGRIDKGFRVDGAWSMEDWPEPWRPDLLPAMRERWRKQDGPER